MTKLAWIAAIALTGPTAAIVLTTAAPTPQTSTITPALLVDRAGKYVEAYDREFAATVCEERQIQRVVKADGKVAKTRTLRSDFLLIKTAATWAQAYRDVLEVDGKPVRNREDRLRKLFLESSKTAPDQARAIAAESRRYNIGIPRSGNAPILPLRILHPRVSPGFAFAWTGARLTFDEVKSPTLLQYRRGSVQRDLIAHGSISLDPDTGRVRVIELTAGPPSPVSTSLSVTYRDDPQLKILVPVEMHERYWEPAKPKDDQTDVSYTYSNFRRFQVATEEKIR